MKKYFYLISTSLILFLIFSVSTYADKGSFSIYPVKLTQESQKAIILHNFKEEVLILGTELKAEKETDVLEFIPFPSEPEVSLAEGNPFEEIKSDNIFQKFIMDNNYFLCEIPKNWEFERNKEEDERYKVYKIKLFAPDSDRTPTTIYVTFYAKENKLFNGYNDFIERNSRDIFGGTGDEDEKYKKYTPVKKITLNKKYKAFFFESEIKEYLHPESKSEEFVIVKERYYVIPSKNGFYVLYYTASKTIFQKYLPVFKRVLSSFKTGPYINEKLLSFYFGASEKRWKMGSGLCPERDIKPYIRGNTLMKRLC
jgi:hypothetical protein